MSINFEHVSFIYGYQSPISYGALEDITFHLSDHFFASLIGHTGSGKSTLVQHMNALLRPTKGTMTIDQFSISAGEKKQKHLKELRKYVGLVFQFPEYQLFEQTVLEDVAFGPKNFGVSKEEANEKAKRALRMVHLDESYENRSPFELSGGERRRVAIAGIIALEPKILVLDEPTAGLDPQGSKEMLQLFETIYQAGTSILLITHDMNVVLEYTDQAIVLANGKLVTVENPTSLFANQSLLNEIGLDQPDIFRFLKQFEAKGFQPPYAAIRTMDQLVQWIVEVRK